MRICWNLWKEQEENRNKCGNLLRWAYKDRNRSFNISLADKFINVSNIDRIILYSVKWAMW